MKRSDSNRGAKIMKRHTARELSLDDFDAWLAAEKKLEAVATAADEEGGPRLSLVPATERNEVWPTDLLPPAGPRAPADESGGAPSHEAAAAPSPESAPDASAEPAPDASAEPAPPAAPPPAAMPFDGVALPDSRKRLAGFSAERQRHFLINLAETGSVHLASSAARLTARSAYRLRARSPAFAAAWDTAEQLAVGRLSALAFDRAINGRTEQVWQQGELVAEKRVPSDKLLMWLLARLDPRRFAAPHEQRKDGAADPQAEARHAFDGLLESLADAPA
jgi:hypothetical protein